MVKFELGMEYALQLDVIDPLANFKDRFYHLPRIIYMDGNSLGLLSKDAEESLTNLVEEWKHLGIGGWTDGKIPWITYAETLGNMQVEMVGAAPGEVVVTGGTTVNLHTLVASFYQPDGTRKKILADELNFPSDLYALTSQIKLKGGEPSNNLVLVKSRDGRTIEEDDIIEAMTDEIAMILLPSVNYRSGQLLDLGRLTQEARKLEIPIGFDCSHSVGVVPHHFDEWNVDFAFWCNYKYVNGGPGATGSIYVNERHFGKIPGLSGWFGNKRSTMFDMAKDFDPARNVNAWQIGTTTMLSTAPLLGSMNMINCAGIKAIREKSIKITSYLMFLIDETLTDTPYSFSIGTPRQSERRGGHVGVEHEDAWRISQALKAKGVIPDFRPPNVIRLAPIPLYTSYSEVWKVVQHMKEIIDNDEHKGFSQERSTVT